MSLSTVRRKREENRGPWAGAGDACERRRLRAPSDRQEAAVANRAAYPAPGAPVLSQGAAIRCWGESHGAAEVTR